MSEFNIDQLIANNFPVELATHDAPLPLLHKDGTRYVLAQDGLYADLRNSWINARTKLASMPTGMPYGPVKEQMEWLCNPPDAALWRQFIDHARKSLPNEDAGLLAWNTATRQWRLVIRKALSVSPVHIDYDTPELQPDEVGVIDVHSHGLLRAFFSKEDDADDRGSMKISAVFGRLDQHQPEFLVRLQLVDKVIPIQISAAADFIPGDIDASSTSQ